MKPTIAEDIEFLVQVALNNKVGGTPEVDAAAARVESWLATYSPDNN